MLDNNDPNTFEITKESLDHLDDNFATWTTPLASPMRDPSRTATPKHTPGKMDSEKARA